jgi:hypothetical protein
MTTTTMAAVETAGGLVAAAAPATPDSVVLMSQFLAGWIVLACAAIGLFFLRFYHKTRDRLFLIFAIAFWVLTCNWVALGLFTHSDEERTVLYVVRLAAFVLILYGVVDKNRVAKGRG